MRRLLVKCVQLTHRVTQKTGIYSIYNQHCQVQHSCTRIIFHRFNNTCVWDRIHSIYCRPAQTSTAQHSTAQHSTAQHSTAQVVNKAHLEFRQDDSVEGEGNGPYSSHSIEGPCGRSIVDAKVSSRRGSACTPEALSAVNEMLHKLERS